MELEKKEGGEGREERGKGEGKERGEIGDRV